MAGCNAGRNQAGGDSRQAQARRHKSIPILPRQEPTLQPSLSDVVVSGIGWRSTCSFNPRAKKGERPFLDVSPFGELFEFCGLNLLGLASPTSDERQSQ
jgi:hypothetical protein